MKPLGAILLAGFSVVPAFAAEPDPWSRVPTRSTGCFPEDGFADRLWAAAEKIGPEIERQGEINAAARAPFFGAGGSCTGGSPPTAPR